MIFYTILNQEDERVIGDVVVFDDGVCVVKYVNYKNPDIYNSLDDFVADLSIEHYLIKRWS